MGERWRNHKCRIAEKILNPDPEGPPLEDLYNLTPEEVAQFTEWITSPEYLVIKNLKLCISYLIIFLNLVHL